MVPAFSYPSTGTSLADL